MLGQGTRFHRPQLKIPHAPVKTEYPVCCNQDPVQPKQIKKKVLKMPVATVAQFCKYTKDTDWTVGDL